MGAGATVLGGPHSRRTGPALSSADRPRPYRRQKAGWPTSRQPGAGPPAGVRVLQNRSRHPAQAGGCSRLRGPQDKPRPPAVAHKQADRPGRIAGGPGELARRRQAGGPFRRQKAGWPTSRLRGAPARPPGDPAGCGKPTAIKQANTPRRRAGQQAYGRGAHKQAEGLVLGGRARAPIAPRAGIRPGRPPSSWRAGMGRRPPLAGGAGAHKQAAFTRAGGGLAGKGQRRGAQKQT